MPKGQYLPNIMDNEVGAMFYHALKTVDRKDINFDAVAGAVGEPTPGKAERFNRMMKAQERGAATRGNGAGAAASPATPKGGRKAAAKSGSSKRKAKDVKEESEGEDDGDIKSDFEETPTKKAKANPKVKEEVFKEEHGDEDE